jgi:N-acetylglucosamine-6-phosphate deacetylase
MLVSDSVDLGGMPPGTYHSHRRVHVVKTQEGKLHLRDNPGLLAGSAQALPWGIAHMASRGICTLTEAWEMASLRPAGFMNLQAAAGLTEGAPADLALFRWDGTDITILQSYKNGRKML